MKRTILLLALTAAVLFAANAPIQQGVTSTKVAFRYTRPDTAACAWEISTDASYAPAVAGGDDDGALGTRWFIGSGLTADTAYHWRITCGAEIYTGQFRTALPPATNVTAGPFVHSSCHPHANKKVLEYGTTPALGSSVEVGCAPTCIVTLNPERDTFLFIRYTYKNEDDVVASSPEVSLHVIR